MIKKTIIIVIILILQQQLAFACKCVLPGPELTHEINETEIIFLGQYIGSQFIMGEEANSYRGYTVRYTFKVLKEFKGLSKKETFVVETGIGLGDCGFEFRPGLSYLIYANMSDRIAHTNICTRTILAGFYPDRITEEVETEMAKIKAYIIQK
ncbi:MAG: hypothetical protein GY705_26755 [Bacteroidetes bacterium]|nr:hypothetical protein [Bacteroidota bacterium]